ncbi:unnamed protein product [Sphagnum compactum]
MEEVVEQQGVEEEVVMSSPSPPKRAREEISDVVVGDEHDFDSSSAAGQELAVDVAAGPPASKKLCIEEAVLCTIPNVLELEDLELHDDQAAADENSTCSSSSVLVDISHHSAGAVAGCVVSGDELGGVVVDQDLLAEEHDVHSLFRGEQYKYHPAAAAGGSECCSALSKEDAARVLRSLEEELGVSSDQSDEYIDSSSSSLLPSSAAQEALVDAALTSWGEEIWNSSSSCGGFVTAAGDAAGDRTAGCSSGRSSLTIRDQEDESSAAPVTNCLQGAAGLDNKLSCALSTFEPVDGAQVDIGFLNEASDDELGIPPSPSSERAVFGDGRTAKEVCEDSMSVLTEAGSLLEGRGDHHSAAAADDDENGESAAAGPRKSQAALHEAVSWALQDNNSAAEDYPDPHGSGSSFHDMAAAAAAEEEEDWLMPVGGLDFLLDFSTGYIPVAT